MTYPIRLSIFYHKITQIWYRINLHFSSMGLGFSGPTSQARQAICHSFSVYMFELLFVHLRRMTFSLLPFTTLLKSHKMAPSLSSEKPLCFRWRHLRSLVEMFDCCIKPSRNEWADSWKLKRKTILHLSSSVIS